MILQCVCQQMKLLRVIAPMPCSSLSVSLTHTSHPFSLTCSSYFIHLPQKKYSSLILFNSRSYTVWPVLGVDFVLLKFKFVSTIYNTVTIIAHASHPVLLLFLPKQKWCSCHQIHNPIKIIIKNDNQP